MFIIEFAMITSQLWNFSIRNKTEPARFFTFFEFLKYGVNLLMTFDLIPFYLHSSVRSTKVNVFVLFLNMLFLVQEISRISSSTYDYSMYNTGFYELKTENYL